MGRGLFVPVLLSALMLCRCSPQEDALPRLIVVDGFIASGMAPQVCLTWTLHPEGGRTLTSGLEEIFVHGARVFVGDGQKEVMLTEVVSGSGFPQFYYTSGAISGEPGKTYSLRVETAEGSVSSSTTVPQPIALDSLCVSRSDVSDTLFSISACFTVPPSAPSGMCRAFVKSSGGWYVSSYGSLMDLYGQSGDSAVMGGEVEGDKARILLLPPAGLNKFAEKAYFPAGKQVSVRLCTMDAVSFHYWADWEDSVYFSDLPMLQSSSNIRSNIIGGLGHWSGYGISRLVVTP